MCVCGQYDKFPDMTATKDGRAIEFCWSHRCREAFDKLPPGYVIEWHTTCSKATDNTRRDAYRDSARKGVEAKMEARGHGGEKEKPYGDLLRIGHRAMLGLPTRWD